MKKRTETIHIRIDRDLLNLLDKLADKDQRKRSDYVYLLLVKAACEEYTIAQDVAPVNKAIFTI